MKTLPIISNLREFTLNRDGSKTEITGTSAALIAKLIKSSIYVVGTIPARFTGDYRLDGETQLPVFSNHGTLIVSGNFRKAEKHEVNAYLGR